MSAAVAQAALEDAISLSGGMLVGVALVDEGKTTVPLLDCCWVQSCDSLMRGCLLLACG